jgi:hypothetical protein
MDFDVIIVKKKIVMTFHIKVAYMNLNKLKFVKDSISNFKGDVIASFWEYR